MRLQLMSLLLVGTALGQQYAGTPIPNSLPSQANAEIAYWRIKDVNGKPTTLINYMSAPGGARQDSKSIQRVVISIQAKGRDAWNAFGAAYAGIAKAAKKISAVSEKTVVVVAPYFPAEPDAGMAYPFNASAPKGQQSTSDALVWQADTFYGGPNNIYPSDTSVSTFAVLDQMLQYFNDASLYPNLKHVVVAGHSMGGQTAQRYAVAHPNLGLRYTVSYWVGNPGAFAWFNSSRPVKTSCGIFDDWPQGFADYTAPYTYSTADFKTGASNLRTRYNQRRIGYARGLDDTGDASDDCSPFAQGANRKERFLNWMQWFPPAAKSTVDYIAGVGHDGGAMMGSTAGVTRLFLDNWWGNGTYAADMGARQVAGDNPHPSAA